MVKNYRVWVCNNCGHILSDEEYSYICSDRTNIYVCSDVGCPKCKSSLYQFRPIKKEFTVLEEDNTIEKDSSIKLLKEARDALWKAYNRSIGLYCDGDQYIRSLVARIDIEVGGPNEG